MYISPYNYYTGYNIANAVTTTSHCDYNTVSNWSNAPSSTSASCYFIYNYVYGATTQTCNYNKIKSHAMYGTGTIYNIYNYGYYAGSNKAEYDTIANESFPGTAAGMVSTFYGLLHYGGYSISGSTSNVDNNYINNVSVSTTSSSALSGSSSYMYSMYIGYGATTNVYNNTVSNMTVNKNSYTSNIITGMYLYAYASGSGANYNVYNNFIENISAPYCNSYGTYYGLTGMIMYYYGNIKAYNNTIYLNNPAGNQGTSFHSADIEVYNSGNYFNSLTLQNNILYNNSTAGTSGTACNIHAYQGTAGTAPVWYNAASNNNAFYVKSGANYYFYGEGSGATISSNGYSSGSGGAAYFNTGCSTYKGFMNPMDAASFYENPPFKGGTTYPDNLKVSATVGSSISRGGIATSLTTDYFGNTRSSTAPSVGAYEFTGIYTSNSAPAVTFTALSSTGCITNPSLKATINSPNGVSTTVAPRLYYKLSTDSNSLASSNTSAGNGWKYVSASGSTGNVYSFTMDYSILTTTPSPGSTVQYFVVCQDTSSTPNFGSAGVSFTSCPTQADLTSTNFPVNSPSQFNIIPIFAGGTYTVGAGGNFPNLTGTHSIFDTINKSSINGPITLKIISDITEPSTVTLNTVSYSACGGGSNIYRIRITTDGNSHTLSSSNSTAVLQFNTVSNLTIDGKNQLTIYNTYTGSYGIGVMLSGGGCQYDSILNCNMRAYSSSTTSYGLVVGNYIGGTVTYEPNNSFNVIAGNNFNNAYYGMAFYVSTNNNYNTITNNTINSNIGYYGMYLYSSSVFGSNNTVSNNTIQNCSYGIYWYGSSGWGRNNTVSGNTINNITYYPAYLYSSSVAEGTKVLNNNIGSPTGPVGYYGMYLYNHDSALVQGNEIQNCNYYYGMYMAISNTVVNNNKIHDVNYTYYTYGIYAVSGSTSGKNNTITNNKIYNIDLATTNSYGGGVGIYLSTTSASNTLIANNMISGLGGTAYYSPTSLYGPGGISLGSATGGVMIYHNSIAMGGTNLAGYSSGTVASPNSVWGIMIYGGTSVDIRNNIFMDTMKLTSGASYPTKHFAVLDYNASATNLTCDYNVYYFNTTDTTFNMGYVGNSWINYGGRYKTLSAWQSGTGLDAHSIVANPHFYSFNDLHTDDSTINDRGTTALLSVVGKDIDGNTRPAAGSTNPDPGASEFTPAVDLGLVSFSAPAISNCYGSSDSITVSIKNFYSRPLNFSVDTAYVTYTISGVINQARTKFNIPKTTPSLAAGATMSITIAKPISISAYGTFTVTAALHTQGDGNHGNDTIAPARVIQVIPAMAGGVYTVGAGGNFATLTGTHGLFDSINKSALSGPITAKIISDIREPETVILNTINYAACAGGSSTYRLRITTDGNAHTLTDSVYAMAVIGMNSVSNVTIDGNNQLTLKHLYAGIYGIGLLMKGGNCQNDTVMNLNISGYSSANTSYGLILGGYNAGSVTYTANNSNNAFINITPTNVYYGIATEVSSGNNNNTFANNTVNSNIGYYGMYLYSSGNWGTNNLVTGNTVQNCSYGIYMYSSSGFARGNTISNNTINAINYYPVYFYSSGTAEKSSFINNKIGSPTGSIGYYQLYMYNHDSALISGNEFQNGNYYYGIYGALSNSVITNNKIHDINYSYYVYGIYLVAGSAAPLNNIITNNTIYNLNNTGTPSYGGGTGIYLSLSQASSNTLVANNAIMNMGGTSYYTPTSLYGPAGITLGSGTGGVKIYHNTIDMTTSISNYSSGTSTTPNSTFGIFVYGGTADIRNNMIIDTLKNASSTYPSNNYCIFNYNSVATNLTSDYNLFYTGTSSYSYVGYLGSSWYTSTNNKKTLANWQSATSLDAHSTFKMPTFYSTTDPHLNDSTVNDLGTTALLSVVSTDINGKTRPASGSTYPDVGAVEFTPGIDLGIVGTVTPGSSDCYGNSDSIRFTIKNYYSRPFSFTTDSAYINYSVSGAVTIPTTKYKIPSTTPSIPKNGSINVTVLKPFNISAYGTYKIIGAVHGGGDVNSINDSMTTAALTTVIPTFAGGIYTVGTGGNFATLTGTHGLFDTLNKTSLSGNITVKIISNIAEPGTVVLSSINYAACAGTGTYRVRITTDGMPHTLTCSTANAPVITFNGASNVTIDGKNQLTILHNYNGSYDVGVLLGGGYCQNDSIINCSISTYSGGNTSYGVIIGGFSAGSTSYTSNNSNNVIAGNTISNVYYGLATYFASNNNNNTIANNNITTGIGYYGMYIYSNSNGGRANTVTGNTVAGVSYGIYFYSSGTCEKATISNNIVGTATQGVNYYGMYLYNLDSATVSGNNMQNINYYYAIYGALSHSTITKNIIHDCNYTYYVYGIYLTSGSASSVYNVISYNKIYNLDIAGGTTYGGGVGIYLSPSVASSHTLVFNNVISAMGGGGYTTPTSLYGPAGIAISSGTGGVKVYHNSIALGGKYVSGYTSGTSSTPNCTYGIMKYSSDSVDIRNNIFMDTVANTASAYPTNNYCIFVSNANMSAITCDYNTYYISGTNSYIGYMNSGWYTSTSGYSTITAWRTATSKDANSIVTNPTFNSLIDLHPSSTTMNDKGTTALLSIVGKDFDGNTRPASGSTNPDPGAYEYTVCNSKPTAGTTTKSVSSVCYGSGTVILGTTGSSTNAGVVFQWRVSADKIHWSNIGTKSASNTYTDSVKYYPYTYYRCRVICSVTSQADSTNIDSVKTSGNVTVTNSNPKNCGTGSFSSTLGASSSNSNYTYTWAPASSITSTTGGASITVSVTKSSGYILTANDATSGCTLNGSALILVTPTANFTPTAIRKLICSSTDTTTLNSGVSTTNFAATSITYQAQSSTYATSVIDTFCLNGVQKVGLSTGNLDDGGWFNLPIGFNFNFFGQTYSKFNLSTNGNIQFGSSGTFSTSYTPGVLPTTTILNFAAFSWGDITFTTKGMLRYWIQGYAPNRVCVIECTNAAGLGDGNAGDVVNAWLLLYETTNIVEVHTAQNNVTPTSGGGVKTVGVNNYNGTVGVAAPGRNAQSWSITTPEAWRFTPPSKYSYTWAPSAKILGSNTIVNPIANPGVLGKTVYTLTLYDSTYGCSATHNDTITAYNPSVTFGGSKTVLCQGSTTKLGISFSGVSPFSYTYTDGSSNYTGSTLATSAKILVGPLTTTVYSMVSVSDLNCTSTPTGSDTVVVNLHPTSVVTGSGTICLGSVDTVSFAFTGVAPYNLKWTDSTTSHTVSGITKNPYKIGVSPTKRTNYSAVTLSDANCVGYVLTGNAIVNTLSRPTAAISGTASICPTKSTTMSIALTGKKPWSLKWSDSATTHTVTSITSSPYTFTVSPSLTSKYSVVALNDSNCTSINSDFSGLPKVTLYPTVTGAFSPSTPLNICKPTSVNLPLALAGTSPWSVTYYDGSSSHTVTATSTSYNLNVSIAGTGVYKITSVSDNHGCYAKLGLDSSRNVFVLSSNVTSVTPVSSTVCNKSSQLFTLTGYPKGSGAIRIWQYSADQYAADKYWTNFGTNNDTATLTNITKTVYVRALDSAAGCTVIASSDGLVKVDSASKLSYSNLTSNSVQLSWTPVVGASSYTIHYGSSTATTSSTSYYLGGLLNCTNYTIYVSPNSSACSVGNSNTINLTTLPKSIILSLDTIAGHKVKAHWNGVKGNRYKLYIGSVISLPNTTVYTTKDTTYSVPTNFSGLTIYAYVVLDSGSTCASKPISATKYVNVSGGTCTSAAPTGVTSSAGANSITVAWTGSSSYYNIFYKPVSGAGSTTWKSYRVTGSSYTITSVTPNTCYVVFIANVCSYIPVIYGYTSQLDTICTPKLCNTPANLVLSSPTCHGFVSNWNSVSGVSGYSIYYTRTTGVGAPASFSYRSAVSSYTITSLSPGTSYSVYVVSNCNGGGQSLASNTESTTTLSVGCKDEIVNGNVSNGSSFSVYPNPNTGSFVINMSTTSNAQTATLEVFDVLGRVVYSNNALPNNYGLVTENVSLGQNMAKGIYVVRVICGKDIQESKIIIQ